MSPAYSAARAGDRPTSRCRQIDPSRRRSECNEVSTGRELCEYSNRPRSQLDNREHRHNRTVGAGLKRACVRPVSRSSPRLRHLGRCVGGYDATCEAWRRRAANAPRDSSSAIRPLADVCVGRRARLVVVSRDANDPAAVDEPSRMRTVLWLLPVADWRKDANFSGGSPPGIAGAAESARRRFSRGRSAGPAVERPLVGPRRRCC